MKLSNTKLMPIDLVEKKTLKQVQGDTLSDCHSELVSESKKRKGFTLAEVLITLTILGVVAAIVIPAMMRNNGEVAERTKMKKVIVDFEKIVENMRINENYQSVEAMKTDMNVEGCPKPRTYFKIKTGSGCTFETNDGVWWDISDITTPIVSVSKDDACRTNAALSAAAGTACYNKTFNLTVTQGTAAQGYAFIINDPSGKAKKALAFVKLTEDPYAAYSQKCTCSDMDAFQLANATPGTKSSSCSSCTMTMNYEGIDYTGIADDQGRLVFTNACNDNQCDKNEYTYNDDGGYTMTTTGCDSKNNTICPTSRISVMDSQGRSINEKYCDDSGCEKWESNYNTDGSRISTYSTCQKENMSSCTVNDVSNIAANGLLIDRTNYNNDGSFESKEVYVNDGSKVTHFYSSCNVDGKECYYKWTPDSWLDDGNFGSGGGDVCHKVDDPMCRD